MSIASAVIGAPRQRRDYAPFLKWLMINALAVIGILLLFHLGLIQLLLATDRTHMSVLIFAIFVLTICHCMAQTLFVSRELIATRLAAEAIGTGTVRFIQADGAILTAEGRRLPEGELSRHIGHLISKARIQGGGRTDQTLLLRALADRLRAREKLGWFVSEALLRLALLGTAVGFILMLVPIAGLSGFDVDTLRKALAGMSSGMAVALNVTVTGIAAALVLKLEYYVLDQAIAELFGMITEITEVHVVSAMERPPDGRV